MTPTPLVGPYVVDEPAEPALICELGLDPFAFIRHLEIGNELRLDDIACGDIDGPHHTRDPQGAFVATDKATPKALDYQIAIRQHIHHSDGHTIHQFALAAELGVPVKLATGIAGGAEICGKGPGR